MVILLLACGVAPAPDTAAEPIAAATEGTASFRFAIDEDHAATMVEPPTGVFYGGLFHGDDVTAVGVTEDAASIEEFKVDLELQTDGTPTEVLYTSGPLPVGKIYVLGYLDSDANGPHTGPDQGDPVTQPGTDHRFEVIGGQDIDHAILLDMVMP